VFAASRTRATPTSCTWAQRRRHLQSLRPQEVRSPTKKAPNQVLTVQITTQGVGEGGLWGLAFDPNTINPGRAASESSIPMHVANCGVSVPGNIRFGTNVSNFALLDAYPRVFRFSLSSPCCQCQRAHGSIMSWAAPGAVLIKKKDVGVVLFGPKDGYSHLDSGDWRAPAVADTQSQPAIFAAGRNVVNDYTDSPKLFMGSS